MNEVLSEIAGETARTNTMERVFLSICAGFCVTLFYGSSKQGTPKTSLRGGFLENTAFRK